MSRFSGWTCSSSAFCHRLLQRPECFYKWNGRIGHLSTSFLQAETRLVVHGNRYSHFPHFYVFRPMQNGIQMSTRFPCTALDLTLKKTVFWTGSGYLRQRPKLPFSHPFMMIRARGGWLHNYSKSFLSDHRFLRVDFTMCNPPFYSSHEDVAASAEAKEFEPNAVCNSFFHRLFLTFHQGLYGCQC